MASDRFVVFAGGRPGEHRWWVRERRLDGRSRFVSAHRLRVLAMLRAWWLDGV